MFAAVPARVESMFGTSAVTVTFSVTDASVSLNSMVRFSPRPTVSTASVCSLKPLSAATTRYGPPTRTLKISKRPSPLVTASYLVPVG